MPSGNIFNHDARTHGRADGDLADEGTLASLGRACAQSIKAAAFDNLRLVKAGLANTGMHNTGLFSAILISPVFAALTAAATSGVTVPSLGFGIRPRGPSTLPSRPTTPIMSGLAITRSKLDSPLDGLGQILGANQIGTRRLGFIGLGVTGKDSHTHGLARAVRHGNHTAHHLVGMARVDTQIMAISMVSSKFEALALALIIATASDRG